MFENGHVSHGFVICAQRASNNYKRLSCNVPALTFSGKVRDGQTPDWKQVAYYGNTLAPSAPG
jgi:hypothetical protein